MIVCPHCGNCVQRCFHAGDDWVEGVQKSTKEALQIAYDYKQLLLGEVYTVNARIQRYEQMIKDEK